jgi:hypothetical protein
MSRLGVSRSLWELYKSAESTEQYRTDPDAFLARFELEPDEAADVRAMDVRALFERGIHPFLVYMSAFRLEGAFSLEFVFRYVGQLDGLDLRDIEL